MTILDFSGAERQPMDPDFPPLPEEYDTKVILGFKGLMG